MIAWWWRRFRGRHHLDMLEMYPALLLDGTTTLEVGRWCDSLPAPLREGVRDVLRAHGDDIREWSFAGDAFGVCEAVDAMRGWILAELPPHLLKRWT